MIMVASLNMASRTTNSMTPFDPPPSKDKIDVVFRRRFAGTPLDGTPLARTPLANMPLAGTPLGGRVAWGCLHDIFNPGRINLFNVCRYYKYDVRNTNKF